jgi:hypothetical protein
MPVSLFYGTVDRNVPIQMGEYYRDEIPNSEATFYDGEGHFIMYSRAKEILRKLAQTTYYVDDDSRGWAAAPGGDRVGLLRRSRQIGSGRS